MTTKHCAMCATPGETLGTHGKYVVFRCTGCGFQWSTEA